MHQRQKRGKIGKLGSVLAWTLLGAAGCSSHPLTSSKDNPGDPLLGETPATAQPAAGKAPQTGSLPPLPQNNGLNTNAALASQTPTGQTLAITNGDGWARKIDGQPPSGQVQATPTSQPKVEPIPKDTSAATTVTPIQPTAWTAGSQTAQPAPTNEQLDKLLKDHGVLGYNQETVPGGVRLTCVVRSATDASKVQNYYTTAADFPTAAQAIIREIEAQRTHP